MLTNLPVDRWVILPVVGSDKGYQFRVRHGDLSSYFCFTREQAEAHIAKARGDAKSPTMRVFLQDYSSDLIGDYGEKRGPFDLASCYPDNLEQATIAERELRDFGEFIDGGGAAPMFRLTIAVD
jgi:hypothetical protein